MKQWSILLFFLLLIACSTIRTNEPEQSSAVQSPPSPLPDLGKAPELTNEVWLNTPETLRLADLRGKVVLLEMWTFG